MKERLTSNLSRFLAFVILLPLSLLACSQPLPSEETSPNSVTKIVDKPPSAPTNLGGKADSYSQITITWMDNSNNEDGFRIYRNGLLIGSVAQNHTVYQDKGLKYGTKHTYVVAANNQFGETTSQMSIEVKTLNPPITVTIDRIGVISDHDPAPKGSGDIYVYVAVTDGTGEPQVTRIPSSGTISINDNESSEVHQQVFARESVSSELRIVVIAFESDSPLVAAMARTVTVALVSYYVGGAAGELVADLLKSRPSEGDGASMQLAESSSDDFVGGMEEVWTSSDDWGLGRHENIRSGDFRLWLTISGPK